MFFVDFKFQVMLAGTGLSGTFPSLQRLLICVGNCAGVTNPSAHAKECNVRQYFNTYCTQPSSTHTAIFFLYLFKRGSFLRLRSQTPSVHKWGLYHTPKSCACSLLGCSNAKETLCCSNVVWLPIHRAHVYMFRIRELFVFGACTRKPKNEVEICPNGVCSGCTWLPFQRCVFAPAGSHKVAHELRTAWELWFCN